MNRKICRCIVTACLLLVMAMSATTARAGSEPFLGEMIWVSFNFAPRGWASCDGQLLLINQNQALFSLLGTTYGGNGITNFALPDMRGKLMITAGSVPGSGLSGYVQGETGGEASHTLTQNEMPAHSHPFLSSNAMGSDTSPVGNLYGQLVTAKQYGPNPAAAMATNALGNAGGGQPHNNMMPYGTLHCIIALQGIFPSRP